MIVLKWFHSVLPHIEKDPQYQGDPVCYRVLVINIYESILQLQECNRQTRALILSIAVCYCAKLQHRDEFEEFISQLVFSSLVINTLSFLNINDACTVFRREIRRYVFSVYQNISAT